MHVAITGGAGYIGSHLAFVLADAGHHVTVIDNFANAHREIVDVLKASFPHGRISCHEGDILDGAFLDGVFAAKAVDAVVHLAALKSLPESFLEPERYHLVNVTGTERVVEAMARAGVWRMVFCSTAAVYDAGQQMPLTEESTARSPSSPYGQTKLEGEALLSGLVESDKRWKIATVRCFNPAGAHPDALIGQASRAATGGLMENLLQALSDADGLFRVYGTDFPTPDGTAQRDYVHVMDLAYAFMALLHITPTLSRMEVFNVGCGIPISVQEVVTAFADQTGQPVSLEYARPRHGDIASCWCGVDKITGASGWRPKRGLQDMVAGELAWSNRRAAVVGGVDQAMIGQAAMKSKRGFGLSI